MSSLETITHNFADELRRQFSQEIGRDARGFKQQVIRLIRRQLPPRRGRPLSQDNQEALAMIAEGKSVREVLRAKVRGFDQLDAYGRYLAEKALRQAIARRRRTPHKS